MKLRKMEDSDKIKVELIFIEFQNEKQSIIEFNVNEKMIIPVQN